jgi:hypothetical protein
MARVIFPIIVQFTRPKIVFTRINVDAAARYGAVKRTSGSRSERIESRKYLPLL